jgi:hypothetical protein
MNSLFILITSAALGIEVGWVPLDDGGHEYTIQIEPQLLEVLQRGEDEIFSDVPPELNVRRYRLMVGTGKLARVFARPGQTNQPAVATRPPRDLQPDEPQLPPQTGVPHAAEPAAAVEPEAAPRDELLDDQAAGRGAKPHRPADLQTASVTSKGADDEKPSLPHDANKPNTDIVAGEPARPWLAFVAVMAFLCCSLGANLYLGWAAWDARSRYREVLARFRPAAP